MFVPSETRFTALPLEVCGSSGLKLPRVSFGLWQKFGFTHSYETQREILLAAFDAGVTHFDLANRYGPPSRSAEKNFGRLMRDDLAPFRDELTIASKAGNPLGPGAYMSGGTRKSMLPSLDISLRDLAVDYVDVFYHHREDPTVPLEETASALVSAVTSGKALYAGVSNYSAASASRMQELLSAAGLRLLIHQPRYSMFDRRIEIEGVLEQSSRDGVGLIVYSPLAQGMLTDKYLGGSVPEGARAAGSAFLSGDDLSSEYLERASALNAVARRRGQTLAQMALQWVLRRREVTTALIGASSVAQLHHNLAAVRGPAFEEAELAEIDQYAVHGTGLRSGTVPAR